MFTVINIYENVFYINYTIYFVFTKSLHSTKYSNRKILLRIIYFHIFNEQMIKLIHQLI